MKQSEEIRSIRSTNCNCCGEAIPKGGEVRRQKNGIGDLLIWKAACWKKANRKKVTLKKEGI